MTNEKDEEWIEYLKSVTPIKKKTNFKKNTKSLISKKLFKVNNYKENKEKNELVNLDLIEQSGENSFDIDKNLKKNIKKGKVKIKSELDLHGVKYSSAREKVFRFIVDNFRANRRLVLIITGKGKRLDVTGGWKGKGVLKEAVPKWLESIALSKFIVWFDAAPHNKGGDGAFVVYLKKITR